MRAGSVPEPRSDVLLGTVGAEFKVLGGGTPSTKIPEYWKGPIPWATSADLGDDFVVRARKSITMQAVENSATHVVPENSILVATRVGLGKVGITCSDTAFSQDCQGLVFDARRISPRFAAYQLKLRTQEFRFVSRGTTIAGVTKKQLLNTVFSLPEVQTQEAIAERLDLQFSRLEAGVAALKRAQENLKRCRASILKAACEGRLVPTEAELAPRELGQFVRESEASEGNPLPNGWQLIQLREVSHVKGGLTKNSSKKSDGAQYPFLRVANVYANELRLDDIHLITVSHRDAERVLLEKDDLLVVEGNGSQDQVGRVALWNGSIAPCIHQNHLIRVRATADVLPKWLLYYLMSPVGRAAIEFVASSTSGLFTLSLSKVSTLLVLLPPLSEQERIVAEVERRFSILDQMEAAITASLSRATRLRQSILSKAFAVQSGG